MISVLRRKSAVSPWVGLLACGENKQLTPLFQSLHLPRSADRVVIEATCPHLQWRNRAGLAPDFPVMPLVGTQGRLACITSYGTGQAVLDGRDARRADAPSNMLATTTVPATRGNIVIAER